MQGPLVPTYWVDEINAGLLFAAAFFVSGSCFFLSVGGSPRFALERSGDHRRPDLGLVLLRSVKGLTSIQSCAIPASLNVER